MCCTLRGVRVDYTEIESRIGRRSNISSAGLTMVEEGMSLKPEPQLTMIPLSKKEDVLFDYEIMDWIFDLTSNSDLSEMERLLEKIMNNPNTHKLFVNETISIPMRHIQYAKPKVKKV